jgi:hypothetical protein
MVIVRTYKDKTIKSVDTIYCDACGANTTNYDFVGPDFATLEATWGYGSANDGTKFDIQLCEKCFYKVLESIKDKRRRVLGPFKYPYDNDPLNGSEYI